MRRVIASLAAFGWLPTLGSAEWQRARVEPTLDSLEDLLGACEERREAVLERNRQVEAWIAYQVEQGGAGDEEVESSPVPECSVEAVVEALGRGPAGVWAIAASGGDGLLFATVNLPVPGLLVSTNGGESWRYRHLFLRGYNVERGMLVRGLDYRHGLLAVASDLGVLLSRDGGLTFTAALDQVPITAVAISPHTEEVLLAAGDGSSFLSSDGGQSWVDLDFSGFIRTLSTTNRLVIDHVTSLKVDPADERTVYVGTGSHLYRLVLEDGVRGRWQAMEGRGGPALRVHDDSTVYNIAIGRRFMISTCNGVYVLERHSPRLAGDQAEVTWSKFRDGAFANRSVGGPKGNLRSYFVTEDPADPDRILIADFAGLYEGRSQRGRVRWRRVEGLPFYSPEIGHPEYTAIAWASDGKAVVGSRNQGIFVQGGGRSRPPPPVDTAVLGVSRAGGRAISEPLAFAPAGAGAPPWANSAETLCSGLAP